jgi:predicted nucleic acid-binding protein
MSGGRRGGDSRNWEPGGRATVIRWYRDVEIHDDQHQAVRAGLPRPDAARLSLVDAVFSVMRSLALDGAFTFDRDFRDCGFAVFPD